jgi:hypothetical protein
VGERRGCAEHAGVACDVGGGDRGGAGFHVGGAVERERGGWWSFGAVWFCGGGELCVPGTLLRGSVVRDR